MRPLLLLLLGVQLLLAAPAFHGQRSYTQPDGTVVEYRVQGDEHLHWNETDDGDILLYNKANGRMEYAEIRNGALRPSGIAFSKSNAVAKEVKLQREEINELHKMRRDEHLSKMKSRHTEH